MMWQAFVYTIAMAAALSLSGPGLERLAARRGLPLRAVWATVMALSLLVPAVAIWRAKASPIEFGATAAQVSPDDTATPARIVRREDTASQQGGTALPVQAQVVAEVPSGSAWPPLPSDRLLLVGWLVVSLTLTGYLALLNLLLRLRAARWRRAEVMGQAVRVSEDTGPALLGTLRPIVVVPGWFFSQPAAAQSLILEHERQHCVARDPLLLWAGIIAAVAVPWNLPLWWQLRRLRLAMELDCDQRVLRTGVPAGPYGNVLVAVARRAMGLPVGAVAMSEPVSALERRMRGIAPVPERHAMLRAAGTLALALAGAAAALALEAPALRGGAAELRLFPPTPARPDVQADMASMVRIVRERHPEVFDVPMASGAYVVSLLLDTDTNVRRSEARHVEDTEVTATLRESMASVEGARYSIIGFQKDRPLPDGKSTNANVMVFTAVLPRDFDASRAVSRVHDAVRKTHADLMLPVDGPVLNRLTVFLDENGNIERHAVEQSRREDLRRAPLEDAQFAERMAARISGVLALDPARLGVVGFTYVNAGTPGVVVGPNGLPGPAVDQRSVLVQYAWPRKPGDAGPSMPMAAPAQQASLNFDRATALRLVEHYLPDAFTNTSAAAGTPTIALTPQGEVIGAGRVHYGSGVNHDTLVREQLVPGMQLGTFISPTLTNAAGQSAIVSFAWQAGPR